MTAKFFRKKPYLPDEGMTEARNMAKIDRISKGPWIHFKDKMLTILIASVIVISLVMAMLIIPPHSEAYPPVSNVPAHISYTTHAPISINGDTQFNNALFPSNGVVSGNGTIGNPYVIEGWDINASSAIGLEIISTTAFFIVRNVTIHDGGTLHGGLFLDGADFGRIENCTIFNNTWNARLWGMNITLTNSNISTGSTGIDLGGSPNVTIAHNTIFGQYFGILMGNCANVIIEENIIHQNYVGIYPSGMAHHVDIRGNNITHLGHVGFGISFNGAFDFNISENNISGNEYGIEILWSNNVNITENNLTDNVFGIHMLASTDISIQRNDFWDHSVVACGASAGTITERINISMNHFWQNADGIMLWEGSKDIAVSVNVMSHANSGISVHSMSDISIIGNRIDNATWEAIGVYDSDNITVKSNNITHTANIALYLYNATNSTIIHNDILSNLKGIHFDHSNSNLIKDNLIYGNTRFGINISLGSFNLVWHNRFVFNNGSGDSYDPLHIQAIDSGTENRWNSSGSPHGYGNYWHDLTTPDANFDGIVDWSYNLTGSAGAKDYYPLTQSILVESVPPTTSVGLAGTLGFAGWYVSDVTVTLTATDNVGGSGVKYTMYRIDSGSWLTYTTPIILTSEGSHPVEFKSTDLAGNAESTKSVTVKIDKTDPVLTIDQTNGFEIAVDYAVISWIGSDATSGIVRFEVSIDGGAFASVGMAMSHNFSGLADGTHNVTVKAVDAAGNTVEQTIQFTVDTSVPSGGGGTSGDLTLYMAIIVIIIVAVIAAIAIPSIFGMRRKKSPPKTLEEMRPEPPAT
jgi:parallel beta-helix repeat protein